MPTPGEKDFMADTGGDLTPEQVTRNLTIAALEDAITLTVNLLDALKQVEFESNHVEDFDRHIFNPYSQTLRGWLKTLHNHLLDIQAEYQKEAEDGP